MGLTLVLFIVALVLAVIALVMERGSTPRLLSNAAIILIAAALIIGAGFIR